MSVASIVPGIWIITFTIGQAYLIEDERGFTLIDTGIRGAETAIFDALHTADGTIGRLHTIILTHWHADHTGSAAALARQTGAVVMARPPDADVIRGAGVGPPPNLTEAERSLYQSIAPSVPPAPAARVDRDLKDGDELDIGGGARVIAVPGHTAGSIALHLPERRILFTGDTVACVAGRPVLGPFNVDRAESWRSFARLAALDAETALFGHGEPLLTGAAAAFKQALANRE